MPYVITTKRRVAIGGYTYSRRAVATLEEAREAARDATATHCGDYALAEWDEMALTIPASGGTVGPLPDGTVIEVAHVDLIALMNDSTRWNSTEAQIIDAFNARQGHAAPSA